MKSPLFTRKAVLLFAMFPVFKVFSQKGPDAFPDPLKQRSALLFVENKGQVADEHGNLQPEVLFSANSSGARLWLSANSISYQFTKIESAASVNSQPAVADRIQKSGGKVHKSTHRFTLKLDGANPHPAIETSSQAAFTENYYLPHCAAGLTGLHAYEKITYKNIYPQIDWVVYSKNGLMEYDFIVRPGGDPSLIRLKVTDALDVAITRDGSLLITTSLGKVMEKAPVSFSAGRQVHSSFRKLADGSIGFEVAAVKNEELRIDPTVTWATYYGGNGGDYGYSTKVDAAGNTYLCGYTYSTLGIAAAGFQDSSDGSSDAFLVKFNSNGTRLWATYYGGADIDAATACAVDISGNLYMCGSTNSTGLATGGFQNTYKGNQDAFLVKFGANGNLTWATYFGGTSFEEGNSCAVDNAGNVYLAGVTSSNTGIAFGGYQAANYGNDAFLVKFTGTGNRLWSTYYGGLNYERAYSCLTDTSRNVYMAGYTSSTSGIASGGFQNSYGGGTSDAFMVKFNSSGSRLWGSYFGGSDADQGYDLGVDGSNKVFMTGFTRSLSGIAAGGFQNTIGAALKYDAFLLKASETGSLQWSTYYGGPGNDYGRSCAIDSSNNIYLSGATESATGIASGGFQNNFGGSQDAYVAKFRADGTRIWGSYFGGADFDDNNSCAIDRGGNVYLAGYSLSTTGIASGGYQNSIAEGFDCFLTKVDGSSGILPVTLGAIRAYQQGSSVQVAWNVLSESNVNIYEIERSVNASSYLKLGYLKAAGSNKYQFTDVSPVNGKNFYRVKIVDNDGQFLRSQVMKVVVSKGNSGYELYPNPVTRQIINLAFVQQPAGTYLIRLLDPLLQVVLSKTIVHAGGSSSEAIQLGNNLPAGTYLLQVSGEGGNAKTFKIML